MIDNIYDVNDYSFELDAETRELEEQEYNDWLDSMDDETFEELYC